MKKDNPQLLDDRELLERYYRDGNNEWIGHLLNRYTMMLFGVCMKYLKNETEARDAVQQIFLKVLHELPRYKVEYFKSWLYMIAKNHCLLWFRNQKHRRGELESQTEFTAAEDQQSWEEMMQREKSLQLLQDALPELNDAQRLCIIRFYLEKKSYLQIAESTGFTMMQVKSHIQNGKRNLKLIMEKLHQDE